MTDIMTLHQPPGWRLFRLGQLFDERKEKVSDKDYPPLSVTMNGIVSQLETAAKSDDGDNRKLVKVGDYVINSRSDRKGSGGISSHDGSVSLISIVMKPKGVHPRFAHHLLRSRAFQEEFYRWGHGIVADLWTTRYADMKNIRLCLPDLDTQKAIADFLDCETARIDQLIEKKQRFLHLSDQAITVKISDIIQYDSYECWRLKHLIKYGSSISYGIVQPGDHVPGGIPFIQTANLVQGKLSPDELPRTSADIEKRYPRSRLSEGDVLLGIRASIGKSVVVGPDLSGVNLSRGIAKISPREGLLPEFLCLIFETQETQQFWLQFQQGSTFNEISIESVRRLPVPLPTLERQEEVCRSVRSVKDQYGLLFSKIQSSTTRLQEFRSALITAAVTGQIDIKTWGKDGTTDRRLDQIEEEMSLREARA